MNIITKQVSQCLWYAYDDDTYDGAPDSESNTIGYGASEQKAIDDLKEQLEDAEEELTKEWWAQQDQDDEFIGEHSDAI